MSNRVIVMMMTSVMVMVKVMVMVIIMVMAIVMVMVIVIVMVIVMVMVMVSLVIHRAESHTCEHQFLTDISQDLQNVQCSGIGGIYAYIYYS